MHPSEEGSMNESGRIWVNRLVAFAAGGLLAFAIMSLGVVNPVRRQKEALAKQLDEVQYGAARLLGEAKVLAESKSYDKALETLHTLFAKQPGSSEMVEGRKLYTEVEIAIQAKDRKWEAAVGAIRAAWEKARAAELLAKAEEDRQLVKTSMADTLNTEWEKAKDQIRQEWEKK
jgi:predicted Zn-dependent protease